MVCFETHKMAVIMVITSTFYLYFLDIKHTCTSVKFYLNQQTINTGCTVWHNHNIKLSMQTLYKNTANYSEIQV